MAKRGSKDRTRQIREFIVNKVSEHPHDITSRVARTFHISRQAAFRHIKKLLDEGVMKSEGETRKRRYALNPIADATFPHQIGPDLQEDVVWRDRVRPLLTDVAQNVLAICEYGLTEMLNNAVDHSGGTQLLVSLKYTPAEISMRVSDNGVGIFRKIQSELHLDDEHHAILELSKGKLTTDPAHHTGEGIFFTSRVFDGFAIISGSLAFAHLSSGDWLVEDEKASEGTTVFMHISPKSNRKLQSVFDKYASGQDDYGFTRTHVPVALAKYGDENLVSRSQAKRLLARFDRFREISLDFKGVDTIGQAFADEVFRVFPSQHAHTRLSWINANEQIKKMIRRAMSETGQTSAQGL